MERPKDVKKTTWVKRYAASLLLLPIDLIISLLVSFYSTPEGQLLAEYVGLELRELGQILWNLGVSLDLPLTTTTTK